MTKTLDEMMEKLGAKERADVEARAAQLVAEEAARQSLRRALNLTPQSLAGMLGVDQSEAERIEQHGDLLLSALQRHIQAMGGALSLVVEMPDRAPVVLSGFSDLACAD